MPSILGKLFFIALITVLSLDSLSSKNSYDDYYVYMVCELSAGLPLNLSLVVCTLALPFLNLAFGLIL